MELVLLKTYTDTSGVHCVFSGFEIGVGSGEARWGEAEWCGVSVGGLFVWGTARWIVVGW
jgi:hypothetical protein